MSSDKVLRERLRGQMQRPEAALLREFLRERRKRTSLRPVAFSASPDRPVLVERSR